MLFSVYNLGISASSFKLLYAKKQRKSAMRRLVLPCSGASLNLNGRRVRSLGSESELEKIETLFISCNRRLDLSFVLRMSNLAFLHADFCDLASLEPLGGLAGLKCVVARGNRIALVPSLSNLQFLDLSLNTCVARCGQLFCLSRLLYYGVAFEICDLLDALVCGAYAARNRVYIMQNGEYCGVAFATTRQRLRLTVRQHAARECVLSVFVVARGCEVVKARQELLCADTIPDIQLCAELATCKPAYENEVCVPEIARLNAEYAVKCASAQCLTAVTLELGGMCYVAVLDQNCCYYSINPAAQSALVVVEEEEEEEEKRGSVASSEKQQNQIVQENQQDQPPNQNKQQNSQKYATSTADLPFYFSEQPECGKRVHIVKQNVGFAVQGIRYFLSVQSKKEIVYGIAELLAQVAKPRVHDVCQIAICSLLNSHNQIIQRGETFSFYVSLCDAHQIVANVPLVVYCSFLSEGREAELGPDAAGRLLIAELSVNNTKYCICSVRSITRGCAAQQQHSAQPQRAARVCVTVTRSPTKEQAVLVRFCRTSCVEGGVIQFEFVARYFQHSAPSVKLFQRYNTAVYNSGSQCALLGYILVGHLRPHTTDRRLWSCGYRVAFSDIGKQLFAEIAFGEQSAHVFQLSAQIEALPRAVAIECKVFCPGRFEKCSFNAFGDRLVVEFADLSFSVPREDVYAQSLQVLMMQDSDARLALDGEFFRQQLTSQYYALFDEDGFTTSFRAQLANDFTSCDTTHFAAVFIANQAFLVLFHDASEAQLAVNQLQQFAGMLDAQEEAELVSNELVQEQPRRVQSSAQGNTPANVQNVAVGEELRVELYPGYLLIQQQSRQFWLVNATQNVRIRPEWQGCILYSLESENGAFKRRQLTRSIAFGPPEHFTSDESGREEHCVIYGAECRLRRACGQLEVFSDNVSVQDFINAQIIGEFRVFPGKNAGQIVFGCGDFSFLCSGSDEFAAYWLLSIESGASGIE